ncbi:MAG: hypothetical protein MJE68_20780, partial [Proteobacteria bacterium]|nr:hypothetical protein [Pseudomonadota bacterium]
MLKHLNLPLCLEVRKSTGASRFMGLFAKGCIQRGTRLFSIELSRVMKALLARAGIFTIYYSATEQESRFLPLCGF